MKRTTFAALAVLPLLAACQPGMNLHGAEFAAMDGGKLDRATFLDAGRKCNEQYEHLVAIESQLYGPYGDWTGLVDQAKACMARHGVKVVGFRQKDGRLEAYPNVPKWSTY